MSVKDLARKQYQTLVNRAAEGGTAQFGPPPEGWITSVRKAIGMSGRQLGNRLGVIQQRISHLEKSEKSGGVTLKTMQSAASAMGCRFVYAIVPEHGRIEDVIAAQAYKKAVALVERASTHMALENQSQPKDIIEEEIERVTRELIRKIPRNLWDEE